jgi:hypothetical protein
MKVSLTRLFTGHSTRSQNDDNHFSLETYDRLPDNKKEKYKRKWIKFLRKNSIDDEKLNKRKIWPKALSDRMGNSDDLENIEDYMKSEHEFINSSIFEKIFTKNSPYVEYLDLKDFGQLTRESINNNISFGNRIIISRVIESNVNGAFGTIPQKLQEAFNKDYNPLIQLYLSPLDSLSDSAKNEADDLKFLLSKGCPKNLILKEDRGISPEYHITQLRYLWLYLGTITFAYAFSRWQPNYFSFHYSNNIPSARCTIIEKKSVREKIAPELTPSDLGDTFYIQLHKDGVGFDGSCYKYFGESQFDHDLYKEFNTNSKIKSINEITEIYNESSNIENKILCDAIAKVKEDNHNYKFIKALKDNESILIERLKQANFKLSYVYEKEFNVLSFANIWRDYYIKNMSSNDSWKLEDINQYLGQITYIQASIDLYLSKIRKPIEKDFYGI